MKLNERIKSCRLSASLSQEEVAELVGVSRQAVTKWEAGKSAPSTENLFRLAEIFGTTVDMLLPKSESESTSERDPTEKTAITFNSSEKLYAFFAEMKKAERAERKKKIIKNFLCALAVFGIYAIVFYICRFIWCDISRNSLVSFLFLDDTPSGEHSYLYGWLLSSNMYYYAAAVSIVPAFFGKHLFPFVTAAGFALGLILGIFFGPYPPGEPYGHGHYGWAIWGCTFLIFIFVGIAAEIFVKRRNTKLYAFSY